ncbi:XRE family transcriptional regulator, partial [Streptomyces sp. WAC04770]
MLTIWERGLSREANVRLVVEAAARAVGSQAALAQELGVSAPTISKWLSGRTYPNQSNVQKLCAILAIEARDLDLDEDGFRSRMFGLPVFKTADVSLRSLRAVEDHRETWSGNWKAIEGPHRFIYAQKDGSLEISEISFVALHKMG